MSTSWQINSIDLDTLTVKFIVEFSSLGGTQNVRKQNSPILHGLPEQHNLGLDLPKWALKFRAVGPAPARYEELHVLRETLKTSDPFTLTAPDAPANQVYFNAGVKTITLSLDALGTEYAEGLDSVVLAVQATEPA